MKRLHDIIILLFIIPGLLVAGNAEMRPSPLADNNLPLLQNNDTTGSYKYLAVDSFRLDIIPPSSGIQFYRNNIVFLSNTKYEGKMLPEHVSFGSVEAYTAIVKDTSLGMHVLFSPASAFPFPCEAITFSNDLKTMYFTKITKKAKKEKIYHAEFRLRDNGASGWYSDENPLYFCTGDYIYTHPALSSDGKILIFSSDMEGSLGGLDLFMVKKEGEKWSIPENLGKLINTTGSECFPYIDNENNLFFSSDGLAGFGGYDIYTCRFNGETWEKPMNLSRRINSAFDDIAFTIDKTDGKLAFFTTRQKSGSQGMQLYKVTLKSSIADKSPASITEIYNSRSVVKTEYVAAKSVEQTKPQINEPLTAAPAAVKENHKTSEKKAPAASAATPANANYVIIKPTGELPVAFRDAVIYRIQFLSTNSPRRENQIVIEGKTYTTYEFYYLGSYRYSIGEFTTLPPARELQSLCRKSGYPQAFIGAFKNNMRSLDLTNFK